MDFSSIKDVQIPLLDPTTLVLADRDGDGLFSLNHDVLGFALYVYRTYCRLAKIEGGCSNSATTSFTRSQSTVESLVTGELVRELWARLVGPNNEDDGVQQVTTHICSIILGTNAPYVSSQPDVVFVDSVTVHMMSNA